MIQDALERHKQAGRLSERGAVIRAKSREPFLHAGRIKRDAIAL